MTAPRWTTAALAAAGIGAVVAAPYVLPSFAIYLLTLTFIAALLATNGFGGTKDDQADRSGTRGSWRRGRTAWPGRPCAAWGSGRSWRSPRRSPSR